MSRLLTVSMTPAFYLPGDNLFRAQLRCLSEQTFKDFDVCVIDAHFEKRRSYMAELAERYKLNIVHVPYRPNQIVSKRLDCAVFNAPYCYSESPRIVRYSCWRFVRPDFTKICVESKTNVDFRFHSIEPPDAKFIDDNQATGHDTRIWDGKSDAVNWAAVPSKSGESGASWGPDADRDDEARLFPNGCYGNYMVFRDQWLKINGCDEVFTNTAHYEDMDFVIRARNSKMECSRKSHILYRLHHFYGTHSGRSNVPTDYALKKNCDACEIACSVLEPNRFDLIRRYRKSEIDYWEQDKVWVCRKCFLSGPWYSTGCHEHTDWLSNSGRIRATIIYGNLYKIGRNLRTLTSDMDGKSLQQKVEIFNDSWSNPRYYQK